MVSAPTSPTPNFDVPTARPDWLVLAHRYSTIRWFPSLMPLDALGMWRVDDHADTGYQRPLGERSVQQILSRFDSGEARDIYVSQRTDGTLWILDGQHTAEALRRLGIKQWPCRVFQGMTVEEEAIWFDRLNNNSRKIPAVVDHNAKVVSTTDPISQVIDTILERYYLRIASAKIRSQDGRIAFASPTVFRFIVGLGGAQLLDEVLGACVDSWGHHRDSFPSRVMGGLAYLLAWVDTPLDRARFLAVMRNTTPRQLIETIGSTGSGGAPGRSAVALLSAYVAGVAAQGYPRMTPGRTPTLRDMRSAEARSGDFWTEETAQVGRVQLHPWYPPAKTRPSAVVREVSTDVAEAVSAAVEASLGSQGRSTPSAPDEAVSEALGGEEVSRASLEEDLAWEEE